MVGMSPHLGFLGIFKKDIVNAGHHGKLLSQVVDDLGIPAPICVILAHSAKATSHGGFRFLREEEVRKNNLEMNFDFDGAPLSGCLCRANVDEKLRFWGVPHRILQGLSSSEEDAALTILTLVAKSETKGMLLSELSDKLVTVQQNDGNRKPSMSNAKLLKKALQHMSRGKYSFVERRVYPRRSAIAEGRSRCLARESIYHLAQYSMLYDAAGDGVRLEEEEVTKTKTADSGLSKVPDAGSAAALDTDMVPCNAHPLVYQLLLGSSSDTLPLNDPAATAFTGSDTDSDTSISVSSVDSTPFHPPQSKKRKASSAQDSKNAEKKIRRNVAQPELGPASSAKTANAEVDISVTDRVSYNAGENAYWLCLYLGKLLSASEFASAKEPDWELICFHELPDPQFTEDDIAAFNRQFHRTGAQRTRAKLKSDPEKVNEHMRRLLMKVVNIKGSMLYIYQHGKSFVYDSEGALTELGHLLTNTLGSVKRAFTRSQNLHELASRAQYLAGADTFDHDLCPILLSLLKRSETEIVQTHAQVEVGGHRDQSATMAELLLKCVNVEDCIDESTELVSSTEAFLMSYGLQEIIERRVTGRSSSCQVEMSNGIKVRSRSKKTTKWLSESKDNTKDSSESDENEQHRVLISSKKVGSVHDRAARTQLNRISVSTDYSQTKHSSANSSSAPSYGAINVAENSAAASASDDPWLGGDGGGLEAAVLQSCAARVIAVLLQYPGVPLAALQARMYSTGLSERQLDDLLQLLLSQGLVRRHVPASSRRLAGPFGDEDTSAIPPPQPVYSVN